MAIGSVHNVYPNGRPSGLPTDIVDQLVQAKQKQRLQPIQDKTEEIEQKKDLYTGLSDTLREAYKATDQLGNPDSFQQFIAGAQNESVATAEATGNAKPGSYNLQVDKVAQAQHQLLGTDDGDTGTGVTQGVSDPDNENLLASGAEVSFFHQEQEYSYTVEDSTSLNDLAESIDEDDNEVNAQVLNLGSDDDPQYVLSLKSQSTGAGTEQITTDQDGQNPGLNIDTTGTAEDSLFLDTDGNPQGHEQVAAQTGQDANFFLDGVEMTRSSNEITDAMQGVTLELQGMGETQVAVAQDREDTAGMIQGFVEAFNEFDAFLDEHASYDEEEEEGGPLMGDSVVRSARNRLRGILNEPVTGTGDDAYQYLSQVGLEVQRDGTLQFDQETFDQAMAENPQAVEKLFTSEEGAGKKLSSMLQDFTGSDGVISSNIESMDNRLGRLEDKQEREYQRLERYQERQARIFTNLEKAVMKYQGTEDELNSILDTYDNK